MLLFLLQWDVSDLSVAMLTFSLVLVVSESLKTFFFSSITFDKTTQILVSGVSVVSCSLGTIYIMFIVGTYL